MSFEPHNVLITGGAGFIGSNFVRHWLGKSGHGRVVVLDALTYAGNLSSLAGLEKNSRFVFVKGDICDEVVAGDILKNFEVDTIVHFAAESHVDRSILGPDEFIRTNVVGTHSLLKAARTTWLNEKTTRPHRFHHVSTDEVYGSLSRQDAPFHEKTPYAPNSPYSASKAASDHLVRAYHETYGIQSVITNCSNNYGAYQFPEKLIPLVIINILSGRPLPVYGDGLQVRDWLHVEDHCSAIASALARGRPGEVYNIGGASETTNNEIVSMLCELVDLKITSDKRFADKYPSSPVLRGGASRDLIAYVNDRLGHDRRYAVNFRKAKGELGYEPRRSLAQGLSATIDWYLENDSWWRPLLGSHYADWIASNYESTPIKRT